MKFYICEHCGNIVTFLQSSGVPVMCCGQKMTELVPDSTDAAQEKHVPVVTVEGSMVDVKVGSAPHPMIPEHYIQWVALETTEGCQIKYLEPGQAPGGREPGAVAIPGRRRAAPRPRRPGQGRLRLLQSSRALESLSDTMTRSPLCRLFRRRGLFLRYGFPSVTCW